MKQRWSPESQIWRNRVLFLDFNFLFTRQCFLDSFSNEFFDVFWTQKVLVGGNRCCWRRICRRKEIWKLRIGTVAFAVVCRLLAQPLDDQLFYVVFWRDAEMKYFFIWQIRQRPQTPHFWTYIETCARRNRLILYFFIIKNFSCRLLGRSWTWSCSWAAASSSVHLKRTNRGSVIYHFVAALV